MRVVCALLAAVLWGAAGLAQSYRVDTYTVEDGLPSSEVYDLTQDASGRLWLATRGGLTSWDGLSFELHLPPEVPTRQAVQVKRDPSSGRICALFMGREWSVGCRDGDVWLWLPTAHHLNLESRPFGLAVGQTPAGDPVVAVATGDALLLGRLAGWTEVSGLSGVRAVEPWHGRFVVLCEQGLVVVRGDGNVTRPWAGRMAEAGVLIAMTVGPDGDVWVLSDQWLARLAAEGVERSVADLPPGVGSIAAARRISLAVEAGGKAVYLATWNAFFRLDLTTRTLERLGRVNGLQNEGATSILVDREGLVWVAGLRGLSKIVSLQFASLQGQHGLLEDEVTAVCETSGGRLVLGHNFGITVLPAVPTSQQHSWGQARSDAPPKPIAFGDEDSGWTGVRVLDLWTDPADSAETVWIAASGHGLLQWRPATGLRRPAVARGIERPTSVTGTDDGWVWIATYDGLLRTRVGASSTELVWAADSRLRRVQAARSGGLWVATIDEGLYRRQDGRMEEVPGPDSEGARRAYSVVETSWGETYVGTRAGLLRLSEGRLVRSREPDGPEVRRPVYCLVEGPDRALWIGTDDGYARWRDGAVDWYGPEDGLVGREANRAAGYVDRHGELWLGTDRGVSRFRPEVQPAAGAAPIVRLDTVLAGDRELPSDQPVELAPEEGALIVRFAAVSLYDETDVTVQTRLMPAEASWSTAARGVRQQLRYANLQPGQYRVSIRARSATGQWSDAVTSAPLRVMRPIWQRAWFVAIAFLAAVGAAVVAGRVVLRARYARLLEDEVAARTAELKASQDRYRWLFHGSVLGKMVVDEERRVIEANAAAGRLCAQEPEQLTMQRLDELPVQWCQRLAERLLEQGTRELLGEVSSFIVTGCDGQGQERDLEVWLSSDRDRRSLLVTVDDVTERRRLEQDRLRASKLESVGQLAGGLAHDFNNILAGILGNLSIARMRALKGEDVTTYLESAETAVERAKGITAQLLTFARGGAPVRRLADVGLLVAENAELILAGSTTRCELDIEEDLWPADVDASQIGQVVNNLVMNAAQAMPEGGVVRLTVANRPLGEGELEDVAPGSYVELTVQDSGGGIPASILDKVFDPYFTTKGSGSGLGLSSVYSIVRQHGGRVTLSSVEGRGTTVTVLIPATPDETPAAQRPAEPEARGAGRVLIMDDDADLQTVYCEVLEELGYEAEVVADGQSALEAARAAARQRRPFDVTVLDLTVPGGMGGREAVGLLKAEHPGLRAVVASGYSSDPVMADHRAAGFDGVLRKPFTMRELAEALEAALTPVSGSAEQSAADES